MKVDKKRVMELAWVWARQDLWRDRADRSFLRGYFVENLKKAWADQKAVAARMASVVASTRTKEEIQRDIWIYENKDTIRGRDWKVLDELRQELVHAK